MTSAEVDERLAYLDILYADVEDTFGRGLTTGIERHHAKHKILDEMRKAMAAEVTS